MEKGWPLQVDGASPPLPAETVDSLTRERTSRSSDVMPFDFPLPATDRQAESVNARLQQVMGESAFGYRFDFDADVYRQIRYLDRTPGRIRFAHEVPIHVVHRIERVYVG